MKPKPFKTTKGKWWYVSNYRLMGKNKLWVGPFDSENEAQAMIDSDPKENAS